MLWEASCTPDGKSRRTQVYLGPRLLKPRSAIFEASIFISHAVWLIRTRNIRRRAKEAELDWEEFPESQAWQEDRLRLPWHWKRSKAGREEVKTEATSMEMGSSVPEQRVVQSRGEDVEIGRDI